MMKPVVIKSFYEHVPFATNRKYLFLTYWGGYDGIKAFGRC